MKVFVMRHFNGYEPGQTVEVDDGWGSILIDRLYAVEAVDAPKKAKKKAEDSEQAAVEGGEA